uniref:Uncharacterized protein n=1 Tax=Gopherus evgoodei TaxID=1825980 RepID=A0A8C4VX38_9SAUR
IPGTFPMRLSIIRSRLFPVRTLTALPMVMLSKLTPFTSVILSPMHRPPDLAWCVVANTSTWNDRVGTRPPTLGVDGHGHAAWGRAVSLMPRSPLPSCAAAH